MTLWLIVVLLTPSCFTAWQERVKSCATDEKLIYLMGCDNQPRIAVQFPENPTAAQIPAQHYAGGGGLTVPVFTWGNAPDFKLTGETGCYSVEVGTVAWASRP